MEPGDVLLARKSAISVKICNIRPSRKLHTHYYTEFPATAIVWVWLYQ